MKTILITGGSSGIGYEMSLRFAAANYRILWTALDAEELKSATRAILIDFPDLELDSLALDMSRATAVEDIETWVKSGNYHVDVLINNAGFATFGPFLEQSMERELAMINLNVRALYQLTRVFLEPMVQRNAGTIINISSNTSLQPVPKMAAYAATKSFVSQFSQSLSQELKAAGSPVRVITICPAAIKDTNFKAVADMQNVQTFEGLAATTRKEVADDVWAAFTGAKNYLISGARMRVLHQISKIIPAFVMRKMVESDLERK